VKIVIALVLSSAVLLSEPTTAGEGEAVRIRVSPHTAFAPADLFIQVTVEPNVDNRLLEVTADSGDFLQRSERQIEGDSGPRVSQFRFRGLPAGEYEVRARVLAYNGRSRGIARNSVTIIQ
jgi:hypothetical protein